MTEPLPSWKAGNLQYIRDADSLHLHPLLNVSEATQFKERIYVVEETPGSHEPLLEKKYSGHVIMVTDKKSHWPKLFL